MKKVRYFYKGDRGKANHNGIVTAAYYVEDGRVYCGFAFCSPKDKFSKKLGREIAEGRLFKNPKVFSISPLSQEFDNPVKVIDFVLSKAPNLIGKVPRWFEKKQNKQEVTFTSALKELSIRGGVK